MTIQERINYYKERKTIENEILENRRCEMLYQLSQARSGKSFRAYLNEVITEVDERLKRIEQYDVLIKEFENQASEERSE